MYSWTYEGDGLKLMRELFAPRNIINFPLGNTGTQMGGWYRKEIKSVADLQGLKMRTAGFGGEVLSRMGVVRSEEHTSELQSLMRISYAVLCLTKKKKTYQ